MDVETAIKTVLDCANNVRKTLGPGYLEKVFENALAIELQEAGLEFQQQFPISITYKNNIIGDYIADMLIENKLIVDMSHTPTSTLVPPFLQPREKSTPAVT